jgi:hypothetical protein
MEVRAEKIKTDMKVKGGLKAIWKRKRWRMGRKRG